MFVCGVPEPGSTYQVLTLQTGGSQRRESSVLAQDLPVAELQSDQHHPVLGVPAGMDSLSCEGQTRNLSKWLIQQTLK